MENSLVVFKEQEVLGRHFRVFGTPEEPLFLAKDVAEWIEHNKPNEMISYVDDSEKLKAIVTLSGQGREMWFLSEDGFYEVLMQSRKPIAKEFKKQVKIILKSIRKHGTYMTDEVLKKAITTPEFVIELATALHTEKQKRLEVENQLEQQKYKVEMHDDLMNTDGLLNFIQVADAFGVCGRNTLMKTLRQEKILMDSDINKNIPYSQYLKNGYFEVVVRPRKTKDGIQEIATTLCKPKALKLIKKVLDKNKDLQ